MDSVYDSETVLYGLNKDLEFEWNYVIFENR